MTTSSKDGLLAEIKKLDREKTKELFIALVCGVCIVEDGVWIERYLDRLFDPQTAVQAAREAILNDEVWEKAGLLESMRMLNFPGVVVPAALREVWLDYGIKGEVADIVDLFRDALRQGPEILMTEKEHQEIHKLPPVITIYRGQLYTDGPDKFTNISWTLDRQVAEWYASIVTHK